MPLYARAGFDAKEVFLSQKSIGLGWFELQPGRTRLKFWCWHPGLMNHAGLGWGRLSVVPRKLVPYQLQVASAP